VAAAAAGVGIAVGIAIGIAVDQYATCQIEEEAPAVVPTAQRVICQLAHDQ